MNRIFSLGRSPRREPGAAGWMAAVVVVVVLSTALSAADVSDPVGVFRIRLRGNSDTIVSLPLQRAPLVETTIASRAGGALQLSASVPTLPPEGAFALVMSGALEGAVLPITSASGSTVNVDAAGFDLTALKTVSANGTTLADLVTVVPHWTLDTIFPQGRGVHASSSALLLQTQLLVFDDTRVGKNHAAAAIYYYYSGTGLLGPGWYRVGNTQAKAGTTIVAPHRFFIVRHDNAAETSVSITGGVQMAGYRMLLFTRAADQDQDNLVALPVPVPIGLAASKLVESGAFQSSASPLLLRDQLLVFDNSLVAKNKAASAIYYHYSGTALQGPGWYRVGDTARRADDVLLAPGEGVIIRKQQAPQPISRQWTGVPGYLQ